MSTTAKTTQPTITLPLAALKHLYRRNPRSKSIVFEVDMATLRRMNKPKSIDGMVTRARSEYFSGKTQGFTDSRKLINYLRK